MAVGRRMALLCLCIVLRGLSIKLRGAYCHRGGSQSCWSCSQQRQLPASARIARLLGSELFSSASLDSTRPFQVLSSSGHCVHQSESYSARGRTGALSPRTPPPRRRRPTDLDSAGMLPPAHVPFTPLLGSVAGHPTTTPASTLEYTATLPTIATGATPGGGSLVVTVPHNLAFAVEITVRTDPRERR